MQIALIMLAIVAALRQAHQAPAPQTSYIPADEPVFDVLTAMS